MSKIYTAADQLIGHTPLLELSHIEKEEQLPAHVIAKLEYFNPAGSVKDRIAKKMIDDAEAKGLLKDAALFDIYTGTGIAPGKKSVAFNLTLRADDRSLTAEEADADVKSILTALEQECGAVLR